MFEKLAIRWTIGDVTEFGFDALRLSVTGAFKLFGRAAIYAIAVNTLSIAEARERVGAVPCPVQWFDSSGMIPGWLNCASNMGEGVCWKFCPVRLFPERYELALDNDVILWGVPKAIEEWVESDDRLASVLAEDVRCGFGKFETDCGGAPRNSGIRGLAPGFDFESALKEMLERKGVLLESELDEQGLQVAALTHSSRPLTVPVDEVTICSPFWPHRNYLGRCGAHFVGLNTRHLPWNYYDRPADDWRREHWEKHQPFLEKLVL